jgi:hypothetical protein
MFKQLGHFKRTQVVGGVGAELTVIIETPAFR